MTEFGFLRARRRTPVAPPPVPAAPSAPATSTNSAVSDFLSGRSVRPGREPSGGFDPEALRSPGGTSAAGGAGDPLDLSSPTPSASPAPSPSTGGAGGLLDLSSPPPSASSAPATSGAADLLDLSSPPPSASPAPSTGRFMPLTNHDLGLPTIEEGERRILTVDDPVVHLTRMQSSAGGLEIQAFTPAPNQLLLGCAFETSDQLESIVLPGLHPQGPDPRSPIFRSTPQGVSVNLRAVTQIARFFVIGLPQTGNRSMPGGTLVLTTYGGSRMEVVLDTSATYGAKALLTGYVVEGRIVLRAEHDPFSGTLQQVAGVYGYDQMTWRDPFTPLF